LEGGVDESYAEAFLFLGYDDYSTILSMMVLGLLRVFVLLKAL
jgi:hypothetical protein